MFLRTHENQSWCRATCAVRSSDISSVKLQFLAGSEFCTICDWILLVFTVFSLNSNSKNIYTRQWPGVLIVAHTKNQTQPSPKWYYNVNLCRLKEATMQDIFLQKKIHLTLHKPVCWDYMREGNKTYSASVQLIYGRDL